MAAAADEIIETIANLGPVESPDDQALANELLRRLGASSQLRPN